MLFLFLTVGVVVSHYYNRCIKICIPHKATLLGYWGFNVVYFKTHISTKNKTDEVRVAVGNYGQRLKGGFCAAVDPKARIYVLNFPDLKCLGTLDLRSIFKSAAASESESVW